MELAKQEQVQEWYGCYGETWQDISPEAFSHPAKFSSALIRRIYAYAIERGWLQAGDTVLDPFGGVGLGARDALANGINWLGCELEPRFCILANGCDCPGESGELCPACQAAADKAEPADTGQLSLFEMTESNQPHHYTGNLERFQRYAKGNARAVVVQGDSRYLRANLSAAGFGPSTGSGCEGVVSSPPFAEVEGFRDKNFSDQWGPKQLRNGQGQSYGQTDGQLGAMPPGSFSASLTPPAGLIASPPFAGNTGGQGEASRNGINAALFDRHQGGMKKGTGDDPRNLDHLPMKGFDGVIGSPPYANGEKGHPSLGSVNKDSWGTDGRDIAGRRGVNGAYGATDGQLANFAEGDLSAAIGSPPFAASIGSDSPEKRGGILASDPRRAGDRSLTGSYGETPGQLGGMAEGELGGVVSSPPFEDCNNNIGAVGNTPGMRQQIHNSEKRDDSYDSTPGQLGAESRETFWAAARLILIETYHLLKPGAHCLWVTKAFVRDGKIVDFPGQWRKLSEACGFEFVEEIRAMQVSRPVQQRTIEGETSVIQKATKSFFRRNYEKKFPDNRIDWETVVIMRKPLTGGNSQ